MVSGLYFPSMVPSSFLFRLPSLLAYLLLAWLGFSSVAAAETPAPPPGEAARTVLALLRHQADACHQIAEDVGGRWSRIQGSEESREERIRDWIVERKTAEMASARKAGDLAEELLGSVRSEASAEAVGALQRLARHARQLCDRTAHPVAPLSRFRDEIVELVHQVERVNRELGRLVLADEEALEAALEPYLGAIHGAGVQAEGEYRDFVESERPEETGPTMKERMQQWHRTVYLPAVIPAKRALGAYLKAQSERGGRVGAACRDLTTALLPVIRNHREIFGSAPDPDVPEHLHRAYVSMQRMAIACSRGRVREAQEEMEDVQLRLRAAAGFLSPYGLTP